MMPYPRHATYKSGRLSYDVTVLAERTMFGRHEYQIQARHKPESETCWITNTKQCLTFEEA